MSESDSRPDLGWLLRRLIAERSAPGTDIAHAAVAMQADAARALWMSCTRHRLELALIDAVAAGELVVPPDLVEALNRQGAVLLSTMVRLEAAALSAVHALAGAGIETRVLKGMATAHLDYVDPALRHFADVDLLVRPEDVDHALAILSEAGMRQKYPTRGNFWQVNHSVEIEVDGFEIDLHHRLLHQAAGHLMAKIDLFADPKPYTIGGTVVHALPAPLRLIQAAGQNVLSAEPDRKSSSDADVLMLLPAVEAAYEAANSVGLGWMLDAGMARAARVAGISPPEARTANGLIDRMMRRAFDSGQPSVTRSALLEALLAPPPTTARVLWSAISPGEDYLRMRGRTRSSQLRHQLSRLGSGVGAAGRTKAKTRDD